jgi:tetratricopeptide (TPR) repeat protein
LILALTASLAHSHYYTGQLNEALSFVNHVLDSPPEDPRLGSDLVGFCPYAFLAMERSFILMFMGLLDEARQAHEKAMEIARRLGDLENLSWAYSSAAVLAEFSGETEGCLERGRESFEIAERTGSAFLQVGASGFLGRAHLARGEWVEASEFIERALELAHRQRTGLGAEASWLSWLALARLGLGKPRGAHEAADEAIAVARRRGTRLFEIPAQLSRARVLQRAEGAGAAREIDAALTHAESLIEEIGARGYEPFVHEERANLARLVGEEANHERELREAHRLFVEKGATGHARRLAKELGL